MDIKPQCSIAMATYNGEQYISEQIESILRNMDDNDELLISDDGSTDCTRTIIQNYVQKDSRIILIDGPREGLIKNFEHVLRHATGEIIFLSDQDDIWEDNKKEKVLSAMNDDTTLVLHDAVVFEGEKELFSSFIKQRNSKLGLLHNIMKNSYIGCCMAFKKEILNRAMPFPDNICMHDQWIGLISELYGKNKIISDKLVRYRRHESNASSMAGESILKKIKNRSNMVIALIKNM